jgi:hypothetical protein
MNELRPLNHHDISMCLRRAPRAVLRLLKAYPRKSCIAGGYIRAVIAGEKVNDIDLFASNVDQANDMADFLSFGVKDLSELAAARVLGTQDVRRVIRTDNALTVRGFPIDPQIVHRWTFEDIEDVIPSFDFTIACAAIFWCDRTNRWVGYCDPRFYEDLAAKRLVYRAPIRNEDAGGSMLRVLKFYQRGYRIPLDSLGAVMARMLTGVELDSVKATKKFGEPERVDEMQLAKVLTGLLREVDPNVDPTHEAHMPSFSDGAPEDPIGEKVPSVA